MRHLSILILAFALAVAAGPTALAQSDPDGSLAVTATVSPQVSNLGDPVEIRATVTNVGAEKATFGHHGCPVWYTIDDVFDPPWACAEFWRVVTLEPGESATFPPQGDSALVHSADLFPLGPGEHRFDITLGDAGGTRVLVQVEGPAVGRAALAGRVFGSDAHRVGGVTVALHPEGDVTTQVIYQTQTGEAGYFLFEDFPQGDYRLSAMVNGVQTWWPGTNDPAQAGTLRLLGYRGDVELPLQNDPPPPGHFVGKVQEILADGSVVPLSRAYVTAVPQGIDFIRKGMSDLPDPGPFTARTDAQGAFTLPADGGLYKLFAGRFPGHDYVYADDAQTWNTAPLVNPFSRRTYAFTLTPMRTNAKTALSGQVLAYDPVTDGPPEPLGGVLVEAVALGPLPYEVLQGTRTDNRGRYSLEVFSGTPYFLLFTKDGYEPYYYGNTGAKLLAQGVDAHPGESLDHLNAVLQPNGQSTAASIQGRVLAHVRCPDDARCQHPLAGAVVRVTPSFPTFAPYERRAVTDQDGYFIVHDVGADPTGSLSYYVMAEARGYRSAYYPGGVPFEQAEPLPVYSGATADAGALLLDPVATGGSTIAGQVMGPEGSPLAGVHVSAFFRGVSPLAAVMVDPLQTTTDPGGNFVFRGVENGPYILAFHREGYLPGYYTDTGPVYRWRFAQEVFGSDAAGPTLGLTLVPQRTDGPFIQAGRVIRESAALDSAFAMAPPVTPREIALSHHRQNLNHAFFYMVGLAAENALFGDFVVAGGETGDNGAVILTDLGSGVYYAYADRPGFETTYFKSAAGNTLPITLGPSTPAVLAEIALAPMFGGGDEPVPMVHSLTSRPNPFRCDSGTSIQFTLETPSAVTVEIFDTLGRRVSRLAQGMVLPGGDQSLEWNGRNDQGETVTPGVYFYRILSGNTKQSNKIVVLP